MEVRKCLVRTTGPPFHLPGVEQRGSRRRLPRAGTEGQESGRFRRVLSAANMVSSSSSFWWTAVRTRRHSGHRFGPVHTTALTPRGRGRFRTRAPECCGRGPVLALAMQRLGRARQAFSPSGGDACWIGHQRAGRNRRPHMQGMPSEARECQRHVNLDPVSGPRPHGVSFHVPSTGNWDQCEVGDHCAIHSATDDGHPHHPHPIPHMHRRARYAWHSRTSTRRSGDVPPSVTILSWPSSHWVRGPRSPSPPG